MRPVVGEGDGVLRFVVIRYIGRIVRGEGAQCCNRGGRNGGGVVALIFLLQIDGRRFMRFDMAMRESRIRKMLRDIARMEGSFALNPVHMGVRKGRDELRQRKQQQRENVNWSFHGCIILTWAVLHAVCGEATRSGERAVKFRGFCKSAGMGLPEVRGFAMVESSTACPQEIYLI